MAATEPTLALDPKYDHYDHPYVCAPLPLFSRLQLTEPLYCYRSVLSLNRAIQAIPPPSKMRKSTSCGCFWSRQATLKTSTP